MKFPVTLYHKDHSVYVASGYPMYPIVVQTQEEYDGLAPGWREDPKQAAAWTEGAEESSDEQDEHDEVDDMLDEEEESNDNEEVESRGFANDTPKRKKKSRARK